MPSNGLLGMATYRVGSGGHKERVRVRVRGDGIVAGLGQVRHVNLVPKKEREKGDRC
jgi:hypothetical protein